MTPFARFAGKTVVVTGHTGFKGSWLVVWLASLGARVVGYSLAPHTTPALFDVARVEGLLAAHYVGDIRDAGKLTAVVANHAPEFIFHLAAQPIVSEGYREPRETFDVNVMGTVSLLEAVRTWGGPTTVVVVSSDKCYDNREHVWGYRECDAMGGHDPYSASKGCTELVVASYRSSFFHPAQLARHGVRIASARAGNVIGGGDWAVDRLVPDLVRAIAAGQPLELRRPDALRPWQHVLEPLSDYLKVADRLSTDDSGRLATGWNFGPLTPSTITVGELTDVLIQTWGSGRRLDTGGGDKIPHEATILRLSIDKAISELGWQPVWDVRETVRRTTAWYRAHSEGGNDMLAACQADIAAYEAATLRSWR